MAVLDVQWIIMELKKKYKRYSNMADMIGFLFRVQKKKRVKKKQHSTKLHFLY